MSDRQPTNDEHSAPVSDRLSAIRARLDAATPGPWEYKFGVVADANGYRHYIPDEDGYWINPADPEFIAHAPADIAWLLDEVERLERENADDLLEITRKASDAEDYWMQEAKRLAGRVNALIDHLNFEGVFGIEKEPDDA